MTSAEVAALADRLSRLESKVDRLMWILIAAGLATSTGTALLSQVVG